MTIWSANSYPFGFPSRSKRPLLDILKFLVTTLRNNDKKVAFIRVDEDRELARTSEPIKTCHNMNIIVQTTGGDTSSLNGKSESHNKALSNIKIAIVLNSSHKKESWYLAYQYAIWLSRQTGNRLCGDVHYLLCHGTRTSYKHIKIWVVRVYIISGRDTRKKLDGRSHRGYLMEYADNKIFIL